MLFECELSLPEGFRVGHATRAEAETGCTVVICPPGTRGGVDVRGGGTGTRELEPLSPLANAEGPTAVLMTGGSAFGLAAADGVARWLEQRGLGRETPIGVVPLVATAVVFDASAGEPGARPGPDDGYAACEAAHAGVPERGRVGAGAGAAVGKMLGRDHATLGGVGYAAVKLAGGAGIAAFYTKTGVGTVVAEGKPVEEFEGQRYVRETWLKADLSIIKAWKGDAEGNLVYRMTARNFNPIMAMAAKKTIVEVDEIVPLGAIEPENVITPAIFVHRIVHAKGIRYAG